MFRKVKKFRRSDDSNANIFLVCVCIVMVWRWVWNLLDMYIFPNNPLISNIICIFLWIAILLMDDWKLLELEEVSHKSKNSENW